MDILTETLVTALAQFPLALVLFWVLNSEMNRNRKIIDRLDDRLDKDYDLIRADLVEARRQIDTQLVWMREQLNFTRGNLVTA